MAEEFFTHEFDNGLTLVAQRMPQVSSVALTWALPVGAACDPQGAAGSAAVASNWLFRGAAQRDTRALNDALDALGCQHSESVRSAHLILAAALLGKNLPAAIALYADVLRRAHLADECFPPCRDLAQQALEGLADEPMRLANLLIREKFYPMPLGRNPLGEAASLEALTAANLREHLGRCLGPGGSILAVAGSFDVSELQATVEEHFGDWRGDSPAAPALTGPAGGTTHVAKDTAQVQIALAYAAPVVGHPAYYPARMGQMVLSGGMSSRLFTEVREKRGLVYAVMARHDSLKEHAGVFVYAGTTPAHAAETLQVTVGELRKLSEGIGDDELDRARAQLKSAVVMQGESTSARSGALASDWYHLRRLRSLSEISRAIDAVTTEDVVACARAWPPDDLTVLTLGPQPVAPPPA